MIAITEHTTDAGTDSLVFSSLANAHPVEMFLAYPERFTSFFNNRMGTDYSVDEMRTIINSFIDEAQS